jgi:NAD(P)-dependent dehydrogenase (short-subunit alcohol dehydrogenase family)
MKRLEDRVCIVTGASAGVGEAVAERFAAEGATVVCASRSTDAGERVAAALRRRGGRAEFIRVDVCRTPDVDALARAVLARHGRIDVLVNNAGVGLLRDVEEMTDAEYDYVMDVNVRGVFLACRHVLPAMLRQGRGSIVNVASVASFAAFRRDAVYCASKGAVVMLTRTLALDYADRGIRVNAICPGFIETQQLQAFCAGQEDPDAAYAGVVAMHPIGRVGRPSEVAGAALFLASDDASFVTGASLVVDGGLLTRTGSGAA